jgi:hypothetical protein
MGVPTSEVGYTLATTRRGDHEVHKGHVVALEGGKKKNLDKEIHKYRTRYNNLHLPIVNLSFNKEHISQK